MSVKFVLNYFENTHPAIIDKETWQCVQLEFARQDRYMKEHLISRFHHLPGEKYGFVGKITCKHCGRIYLMRHTEDKSREYWRCSGYKYDTKGNSDCRELRIDGDFPE